MTYLSHLYTKHQQWDDCRLIMLLLMLFFQLYILFELSYCTVYFMMGFEAAYS